MSEFNQTPETSPGRGGRLLAALAVVAVLFAAGVVSLIVLPSRQQESTTPAREVRTAAPEQVSAPGGKAREAEGLLKVGDKLQRFALPDLSGRMTPSSEFLGKTVVLNIWASWCPPCIKEMPSLQALHEASGDDFHVISISVDEDLRDARALAQKYELSFPVLLDPSGDLPARIGTVMFPETWVLDAEGKLIERVIGERDWADPAIVRKLRAGKATGWGS
jgi:thiol-disulfide isomerase/thioredoxin